MSPKDFLDYAARGYESNKRKWSIRLKKEGLTFSEDTYQNTILYVYNYLNKYIDNNLDKMSIEGFWYQAFLTNTKRDTKYAYNSKRDDDVDILKYLDDFQTDDKPILLEDIEGLKTLTPIELNLFLIYFLTDITYTELEELTGIKNVRYKINSIGKKIRECIKRKGLQ